MKLSTFGTYLPQILGIEYPDVTEVYRRLKEQSKIFAELEAEEPDPQLPSDILTGRPGRSGGVDLNPAKAAFVLVALMTTAVRPETARATWSSWHIYSEIRSAGRPTDDGGHDGHIQPCPLTGATMFGDAVRAILADPDLAMRVDSVQLIDNQVGVVRYDGDKEWRFNKRITRRELPGLHRATVITGAALHTIARLITEEA